MTAIHTLKHFHFAPAQQSLRGSPSNCSVTFSLLVPNSLLFPSIPSPSVYPPSHPLPPLPAFATVNAAAFRYLLRSVINWQSIGCNFNALLAIQTGTPICAVL
uniref:Uncharacterized protein n=1 Tax=Ascaris lumbricoides TaxID=6252 RepID=A0A0M3I675_ASCLU